MLGSNTFTPNSASAFVINGQTLSAGGPPIIVSGSILSLGPSGSQLIVAPTGSTGGNSPPQGQATTINLLPATVPLAGPSATQPAFVPPLVVPLNGNNGPLTIPPGASSVVLGPGTTLLPGSPGVTLANGQIVSLATAASSGGGPVLIYGTGNIVNSVTLPLAATPGATFVPFAITNGPGNVPISIGPSSAIVIGGTTLTPGGPAAIISGTVVSLATGSSYIVVGTSTIPIGASPTGTGTSGYGSIICLGIGGCQESSTTESTCKTKTVTSKVTTTKTTTVRITKTATAPQPAATEAGAWGGKAKVPDWKAVAADVVLAAGVMAF
jgi:hypothetical protein